MKLSIAIGASLVAALAGASIGWRLSMLALPPWAADALAAALASTGGPGGLVLLLYAVISCTVLAASALASLAALEKAVGARAVADPKRLPEAWRTALEHSEFAPLAGSITGDELSIAPLALLRVLRAEIWRVFIKRLVASQTVTVAIAAAALAFGPALAPLPPLAPALVLRIDALAAGVLLAGGVAASLLLDRAIERFAAALARHSAAWEKAIAATPAYRPAPARVDPAAAAPSAAPVIVPLDGLEAAVDRLAAVVVASAERQSQSLEEVARLLSGGIDALTQALEGGAAAQPAGDAAAAGAAVAQLAAAIEQLAHPVLEQMKLLGASDRRLIAMLRRQEDVVGALGQRWGELVGAVQTMSAGLASATAAREAAARLLAPAGREGDPALEDELQNLLDEMSDYEEPGEDPERLRS